MSIKSKARRLGIAGYFKPEQRSYRKEAQEAQK